MSKEQHDAQLMQSVIRSFYHLLKAAQKNGEKFNISTAIGEVMVKNVEYQIQISFVANNEMKMDEKAIAFSQANSVSRVTYSKGESKS
jgi:hypothetical protein